MDIVRATPDLAGALTGISLAAKRYWNYPESWIEAWTPQLTITREYVAASPTYAAIEGGAPVGFYALVLWPAAHGGLRAQLDHLWLRPDWIGRGLGRTLFQHAVATARRLGAADLFLEAEPNAEPFYRHMGARRTGERIGEIEGQPRILPLMELDLGSDGNQAGDGSQVSGGSEDREGSRRRGFLERRGTIALGPGSAVADVAAARQRRGKGDE